MFSRPVQVAAFFFYGQMLFRCMHMLFFFFLAYLFIMTFGSFLLLDYCE